MDSYRLSDPLNLNGLDDGEYDEQYGGRSMQGDRNKKKDYKLLIDPLLNQGSQKVYRFEGVNHQDPTPVLVRDPRSRMKRYWSKKDAADLPIPKFKFDQYYVGAILPKEVTFSNLNDNISQCFLRGMVQSFGPVEDVKIYFHPVSKKHLGIGKVVFSSTRAARACAEKLNQSSKMGMIITAIVDSMGKERQKILEELTKDRPKKATFRPPSPPPPSFKDPRSRGPRTPVQPEHPPHHHRGQEQDWGYDNEWDQQHGSQGNHHQNPPPPHHPSHRGYPEQNAHRKEKHRERRRGGGAEGGEEEYNRRGERSDNRYFHRDEHDRDSYREPSSSRDSYNRDRERDRDRDRHSRRDRRDKDGGRYRRDHHHHRRNDRYRDYDNGGGEGELYNEEAPPAYAPPEPPSPPPPASAPPEEDEGERNESLESRIASLLGGALPFGSPEHEPQQAAEFPPPPPPEDEPPLPNAPAPPPLPDEPPPLPPEPDHFGQQQHYPHHMHNGGAPPPYMQQHQPPTLSQQSKDDDCMSLSSVSSGEVEVNPPLQNMPPPPMWPGAPPPGYGPPSTYTETTVMTPDDENNEAFFLSTLEKVVDQLKVIMGKDMSKKVIQNTAFKAFDSWWTEEQTQQQEKTVPTVAPDPAKEVPTVERKAAVDPLTTSLDSLFAKDGPSSHGGLLGLRGGVPKLPSFRRKFIRPPSPPPEEEDDKDEDDETEKLFRGPRTPEDSEESEGEDYQPSRKKNNIYSSDSDEDDDAEEEESEASSDDSEEESEEEEEDEDDSLSEASDAESVAAAEKVEKELSPKRKKQKIEIVADEDTESRLSPVVEDNESNDVNIFSTDDSTKQGDEEEEETSKAVSAADEEEMEVESKEKDSKSVPETEEEDSKMDTLEDGELGTPTKVREEDAALTLLRLHDSKPKTPEQPEYSCILEHNYFMKGTPKKGRPRKDSTQGQFEEIPGVVLNGTDEGPSKQSDETDSASEGEPELTPTLPPSIAIDHQYCHLHHPVPQKAGRKLDRANSLVVTNENQAPHGMEIGAETEVTATVAPAKKQVGRKRKISDVTNLRGSRELAALLPPAKPKMKFKPRAPQEEVENFYSFLRRGIDSEDLEYLRKKYTEMLNEDSLSTMWINDTHWVDHVPTMIPDPPKHKKLGPSLRKHKTGSARTEGYYKISYTDKHLYLSDARGVQAYQKEGHDATTVEEQVNARQKKKIEQSREARSESRRIQNVLTSRGEDVSDLLKFNQLKFRKKQLNFSKSGIHDWGLFALEPIAAEEMVIEYVGAVVRQTVADLREKRYEQMGIGSSYMFRIDGETIIDAYKCGNLARFINHCCNPNCYAKIISVEGAKKIVIYSKRDIMVNEEITYDYKFPLEDEKIACRCGTQGCRGFLN